MVASGASWLALCWLVVGHGFEPAGQGPPASPGAVPVFRAATEVVEVDAVVTDRDGRFVADLPRSAFQLFEDGVPQAIDWLLVVRDGEVFDASAGEGGSTPLRGAPAHRVFVWVLDEDHLSARSVQRVREGLERFLDREFRPADIGGLVTGGRMAGSQLTSVREDLMRWVRALRPVAEVESRRRDLERWPRLAGVTRRAVERARLEEPQLCAKADCEAFVVEKARSTMAALRLAARRTLNVLIALTARLGAVEGRKTLVLFTEGFAAEEARADLDRLVAEAARAGVTMHAIDPRGLGQHGPAGVSTDPGPRGSLDGGALAPYDTFEDGPNLLASATGGRFIRHQNQVEAALSEVARDAGSYYILGYTPSNRARDGTFRTIEVKVARADLAVRARSGYVAASPLPALAPLRAGRTIPDARAASTDSFSAPRDAERAAPAVPAEPPGASTPAGTPSPAPAAAVASGAAVRLRPDAASKVESLRRDDPTPGAAAGAPVSAGVTARAQAGWDAYQRGDVEAARREFRAAVASGDARPWVPYALGLAELASGRPREAATAWEQVRAAVPEYEPVYFDLADAYLQLGETGAALGVLRAAAARWSDDPDVFNALGVVQVRRGLLDGAVQSFGRAAALAPHDATAYFNLGKAFELRYARSRRWSRTARSWAANEADRRAAIEHYRRAVELGGPLAAAAREALARLDWHVP
jgi:VWFA-related protein